MDLRRCPWTSLQHPRYARFEIGPGVWSRIKYIYYLYTSVSVFSQAFYLVKKEEIIGLKPIRRYFHRISKEIFNVHEDLLRTRLKYRSNDGYVILKMFKVLIMCHPEDRPRNTVNSRGSRDQAGKASIIRVATIRGLLRGFQFYDGTRKFFSYNGSNEISR